MHAENAPFCRYFSDGEGQGRSFGLAQLCQCIVEVALKEPFIKINKNPITGAANVAGAIFSWVRSMLPVSFLTARKDH